MKRHAVTLVLALLAVAATLYLLVVDRGTPSDAERSLRAHHVLATFRPDEITRITLDRPNDRLILERDASASDAGLREWRVLEPVVGPADQAAVSMLVALLDSASPVRAASNDPAEFTDVRATLTVQMNRVATTLVLGKTASTPAGAAYARVDANAPVVVPAELVSELLLPSEKFRARQILPNLAERLEHLDIRHGDSHLEWTRTGPASYRLADGERASRAAIDRVALALSDLRAESFVPVDQAELATGLFRAPLRIEVKAEGSEPVTLIFAGDCLDHLDNAIVLREANSTLPRLGACVAKAALAAFDLNPASLVERHAFSAHADEVSELELVAPGAKLEIARKGSGWHERAPDDRDLTVGESEAAALLLDRMLAIEGAPHAKSATAVKTDRSATLHYGEPAMEDRFAFDASGASDYLDIGTEAVQLLLPSATTLRPLSFWDPPLDKLRVDQITLRCDGSEQRAAASTNGWSLTSPIALPADGAVVLDLIDAVASQRAERWANPAEVAARAASDPGCSAPLAISLHFRGGDSACVEMNKRTNGGMVLRVERNGSPPEFAAATNDFRARACGSLVDRHRFVLPEHAETVTLRAANKAPHLLDVAALRREEAEGSPTDAGLLDVDVAAFGTLDGLVADDVAHLGAPVASDRLSPAALVVTVGFAGSVAMSAAPLTLRFGAEIPTSLGSVRRATVDGLPAVFTFSSAKLAPLFASAGVIQKGE